MINHEKVTTDKKEPLQLIGSQVNILSRSNSFIKNRPRSAAFPRKSQIANKTRPKSAESTNLNFLPFESCCQLDCGVNEHAIDEKSSLSASQYTDISSKVLEALLRQDTYYDSRTNSCGESNQEFIQDSFRYQSEDITLGNFFPIETCTDMLTPKVSPVTNQVTDVTISIEDSYIVGRREIYERNTENLKIQSWIHQKKEEKTVKFIDGDDLGEKMEEIWREKGGNDSSQRYLMRSEQGLNVCCQNDSKLLSCCREQDIDDNYCHFGTVSPRVKVIEPLSDMGNREDKVSDASDFFEYVLPELETKERLFHDQCHVIESPKSNRTNTTTLEGLVPDKLESNFDDLTGERECLGRGEENHGKVNEIPQKLSPVMESKQENECPCTENENSDSTYEEIVELLKSLEEEEDGDAVNMDTIPLKMELFDVRDENLKDVYSYLEEVEKDDDVRIDREGVVEKDVMTADIISSPRLDSLLNKNSVELAHEVLSLKLQIEDQKKGIKLLRESLAEMKEANKNAEAAHQEAMKKANAEAEALVQRHQKFIKQLLNQKKNLNDTVSKLVQDLKLGEERYKKNIKAMEEKHSIEIKRVKEAQAVAERVKREKWMEMKTKKIKEMTVKGLEPELSRMAAHQQQEMTELRNLHRAELEAVELRAARRTSELMDQLRADLTKEKENAIKRETEALRAKMEKDFEEERISMENLCQQVKEDLRREKDKLFREQREFQEKLLDCKKEAEKEKQRTIQEYQEKMEEIRRKHLIELKNLKESLEAEKEIWMNNYRKQEDSRFLERERELHQEYKRERDRDIEMVIEALEKDSTQALTEAKEAADNKLKRFKEKFENEIKELEASENVLKNKLSEVKSQLLEKEDVITKLNSQIRQFQTEISCIRKSCEDMTSERANLKEIIRKEFAGSINEAAKEKENLRKEISNLKDKHLKELATKDQVNVQIKNEMQKELARVYSRIKAAVTKKEKIIESLKEENKSILNRCNQLEFMLDQQRRNLLL